MIISLYGPDGFRREERKKAILAEYRKKHSFTAEVFDFERDGDYGRFSEFVRSSGLFESFKLAVIKNANEAPAEFKKLLKEKSSDGKTTVLLSEASLKEFKFALSKPNLSEEFKVPAGKEFREFVRREAKRREVELGESALAYFCEALEGDTWGAVNELEKLSLFKKPISVEVLKESGLRRPHDFIALIRDWSQKSVSEKLTRLESLFCAKEDPGKILNVMAYFNTGDIREFADLDVAVKSGKLEYEEALLSLAL